MLQLDDASRMRDQGAAMAAWLEEDGYLVLPCSGLLHDRIEALWAAGRSFFPLAAEVKQRNVLPEYDGYHAIGKEYSDTPDRPDLAESFWARLIHENETWRLPDEPARELHRAALAASSALEAVLLPITAALARHYAGDGFAPGHDFACDKASHLQFNRYQPGSQTREILTDPHEDGLYLTLLYADGPGLEVLTPKGVWQPLQPRSGEIVAMPGEIFSLLCGYKVQPLLHRVRNHPEVRERFSMMYFANPNPVRGFRPWIEHASNAGIDIIKRAIENPTRYGLPPLPPV